MIDDLGGILVNTLVVYVEQALAFVSGIAFTIGVQQIIKWRNEMSKELPEKIKAKIEKRVGEELDEIGLLKESDDRFANILYGGVMVVNVALAIISAIYGDYSTIIWLLAASLWIMMNYFQSLDNNRLRAQLRIERAIDRIRFDFNRELDKLENKEPKVMKIKVS